MLDNCYVLLPHGNTRSMPVETPTQEDSVYPLEVYVSKQKYLEFLTGYSLLFDKTVKPILLAKGTTLPFFSLVHTQDISEYHFDGVVWIVT